MTNETNGTTETTPPSVTAPSAEAEQTGIFSNRASRRRLAFGILATSVIGLTVMTVVGRQSSIEASLKSSVEDALSIDHPGLRVSVDGRDVKISGAIGNDENRDVIAKIAGARRGVRTVDVSDLKGLADPGANTTKPTRATDAGTDAGSGNSNGDTVAAGQDSTPIDPANRPPAAPPKITANFVGTAVTVGGAVPDVAAKDALLTRLQQATAFTVTDSISVAASATESADMAEYRRVGTFLSALSRLPVVSADINFDRTTLTISGEVKSASDRDFVQREALKLVNGVATNLRGEMTVANAPTTVAGETTTTAAPGTVTVPPLPNTPEAQKAQTDITSSINGRTIKFNKNSIKLSTDDKTLINDVASTLKTNAAAKVEIGGHTDFRGSASSNQRLSQERADAVRQALLDAGIDTARVTAKGYGEDVPVADNNTLDGQAKNRRIEFRVVA
jgi:outer membrane protein OmpA-like peptidoglycan-associated protein